MENCTLSENDQSTKQNSVKANVLLYQSASGDARDGTSVFSMTGGEMTANSGAMFYCTNTSSEIWLNDAELNLSSDRSLLIVAAGCWGKEGKNGGHCALNAKNQMLEGSITVDAISELTISLNSSTFIGAINADGQSGAVQIILGAGSAWTLTGDSYITSLEGETENIDGAGYHLYVNGEKVF